MQHRFVETVLIGFIAVFVQAAAMVPTGVSLFGMSTSALFKNEARESLADRVSRARTARADRAGGHDGKLVTVTGALEASTTLGDPVFFEPSGYAGVIRQVEMFAWEERVSTKQRRLWGGGRQVDTITEYRTGWTSSVLPTRQMKHPEGHDNPPMPWSSARFVPESLRVGAWTVDPMDALVLDGRPVEPADVRWTDAGARLALSDDGWYYADGALPDAPRVGDVRVRFLVIPTGGEVTAVGMGRGDSLTPAAWGGGIGAVAVLPGDRGAAIGAFRALDAAIVWVVRIGGTIGVFASFALVTGPIFAVLDIVPPLGFVARLLAVPIGVIASLGWTAVVIGTSQIAHSTGFLLMLGVLGIGVLLAWWDGRKRRGQPSRT